MKNIGFIIAVAGLGIVVGTLADYLSLVSLMLVALGLGALTGGILRQVKIYIKQNNENNKTVE